MTSAIDHPDHYGGDTPYECVKVIEAWGLGFHLGNTVKYINRADRKLHPIEDLKKAAWYLQREIERREKVATEPHRVADLTCPFCGSDNVKPSAIHPQCVQTVCLHCGAAGPTAGNESDAQCYWADRERKL